MQPAHPLNGVVLGDFRQQIERRIVRDNASIQVLFERLKVGRGSARGPRHVTDEFIWRGIWLVVSGSDSSAWAAFSDDIPRRFVVPEQIQLSRVLFRSHGSDRQSVGQPETVG